MTFDEWGDANEKEYSSDSLHMSEYHMARVVWEAASEAETEARGLLRWALEQLESSEDADTGRTLEHVYDPGGMVGEEDCARFTRAVHLSGYRNAKQRLAAGVSEQA